MIKCENLTEQELHQIGSQVAEAFLNEDGCFSVLSRKEADSLFTLIVTVCYGLGHLYTTGEGKEGFCVYWTKAQRPGLKIQASMLVKMIRFLSLRSALAIQKSQNQWTPTEKRYRKNKDFVEVFLLAVRKEYQGQGYFRQMLTEPFALAEQRGTVCVLDTDAKIKAEKYVHAGMHVVDSKKQRSGVTMYALEK